MRNKAMLLVVSVLTIFHPASAQGDAWQTYSKAGVEALGQHRLDDAAQNLEAALREMKKAGIRDKRLAARLGTLALVYQLQKKYGKAEGLYAQSLETYRSNNSSEDDIALTVWNLGKLYMSAGKSEKAEATLSQALALAEKAKGPENLLVAGILDSLAEAYIKRQGYDEAEAAYKRALPIYEKSLGREHWTVAETLEGYASLLRKMNRKSEASEAEKRAKKIRASSRKNEPYTIP
jgi:tetratricopeptide (TPR) repeat protein